MTTLAIKHVSISYTLLYSLLRKIFRGVEVLHLFQGHLPCSLPLAPLHTSHADIDADGTICIEHMSAILTHPEGMCVMYTIIVFVPQTNSHVVQCILFICIEMTVVLEYF